MPPAELVPLRPVGYTVQPFAGSEREPAQLVIRDAPHFSEPGAAPLWSFTGDSMEWNAINGFVFRQRGDDTVALVVNAKGHCGMVPVALGSASGPSDFCWQPAALLPDNPHSVEYVPAGPGGSRPELVIIASSGDNKADGTLRVYDLEASTVWTMPYIGGHGVLWDPWARRLWALGTGVLSTYSFGLYGGPGLDGSAGAPGSGAPEGAVDGHDGTGWGLVDERIELMFRSIGHDLQPDYSSHGTHLLVTTEETTLRVSVATPQDARELVLPRGSDNLKAAARDHAGNLLWVRQQSYGHDPAARYCDNAFTIGTLELDGIHVSPSATIHLPDAEWTYKLRPFITDYL